MHLKIKRGLTLPLPGEPTGKLQVLPPPSVAALDLSPFDFIRFKLLKKEGDTVSIGEPLAEDKGCPGRVFVSPASGTLLEPLRGLKRRLLSLPIRLQEAPTYFKHPPLAHPTKDTLLKRLMEGGLFPHIIVRPFLRLPHPNRPPEAIFIKALASAPFAVPPDLELNGRETHFQTALSALALLCPVHLITSKESAPFHTFKDVTLHTGEGPHPISNPSLHIAAIHPITSKTQTIWTLDVQTVLALGRLLLEGTYEPMQILSLAGEGLSPSTRGYFKVQRGCPIEHLTPLQKGIRYISGNPLEGTKVSAGDFIRFFDQTFCALPEPSEKRRLFHFLRMKAKSYTTQPAYGDYKKGYPFTTLQHGEERAFIDGAHYERVMPLRIPTMQLIKAILAEDFERAEQLGLLTVAPEDFALPAFICPSKIPMPDLIRQGLRNYAEEVLET